MLDIYLLDQSEIILGSFLEHFHKIYLLCGDVSRILFPGRRAPAHRAQGWNIPFKGTPHFDQVTQPELIEARALLIKARALWTMAAFSRRGGL